MARKSFSKLRSAIAGIYVVRSMLPEAEDAFLESIQLYPLSPEANFRLADLYLRWNRANDAIRIMEEFCRQDPNNDRAAAFVQDMKARTTLDTKRHELESRMASGQAGVDTALELADTYRVMGLTDPFQALLQNMLSQTGLPAQVCLKVARLSAEAQQPGLMESALAKYVELIPSDIRGWIDLGAIRFALHKNDEGFQALQQAIKTDKASSLALIKDDPRLASVRAMPAFQILLSP